MEPKIPIPLHIARNEQGGEIEPVVPGFVDHDLAGFKRPVGEGTLVADDPPDRVVGMVLREVRPEDGTAVVEVGGGVEEVSGIAQGCIVWAGRSGGYLV